MKHTTFSKKPPIITKTNSVVDVTKLCKSHVKLLCITREGSAVVKPLGIGIPIIITRRAFNTMLNGRGISGWFENKPEYKVRIFHWINDK
jgi:hypothetical protein